MSIEAPKVFAIFIWLQNGQTPLMLAAEQGNLEIVKELIKKGANCNLEDAVSIERIIQSLNALFPTSLYALLGIWHCLPGSPYTRFSPGRIICAVGTGNMESI